MGGATVSDQCFVFEVVMNDFREISPANFAHRAGVEVWDGKYNLFAFFPAKEETGLGDKYLFPDFPEEFLHSFRPISHVGDECIDECKSPDFECTLERSLDHPDQDRKTEAENQVENEHERDRKPVKTGAYPR